MEGDGWGNEGKSLEMNSMESLHRAWSIHFLKILVGRFPGGPVVRIWCFQCPGRGSVPGQGTKILQAVQ